MLAGRLGDFSLVDVLRLLADTGKSGTLQVRGGGRHARLTLDGGHVSDATLTATDAALPTPVVPHAVDVVFELLLLPGGEFRFDGPVDQARPDAPLPPDPVVVDASERYDRWPHLLARLGGPEAVPHLDTPSRDEPITLTMDQWRLLARIDGHRSLGTLIAESAHGRWGTLSLLDALLDEGVVAIDEPSDAPGQPASVAQADGAAPVSPPSTPTVAAPVALQPPSAGSLAMGGPQRPAPPQAAPASLAVDDVERLIRGVERL